MQAGGERVNIDNRQVAGVWIGGNVLLQARAEGLSEHEGQRRQDRHQRQALETFAAALRADKSIQGRQGRQSAGDDIICAAAGMDRQRGFPVLQAGQGNPNRLAHLFGRDFADDEEPGRVRVPAHGKVRETRAKHMQGGMLQGVVAAGRVDVGGLQEICHFLNL